MDGKMILIEGLDLAGKSTLVRSLQDVLIRRGMPVRVSRNALCADNPIAPIADVLRLDPESGLSETGHLFLASHLWDARNFQRPPQGTLHLQDSCWLRTVAYHTARGTRDVPKLLREAVPNFPPFDVAVFLTANIEERQRRLLQRERDRPGSNDHGDQIVALEPEKFMRMEAILKGMAVELTGAVVLDTTELRPSNVVELVSGIIDKAARAKLAVEGLTASNGPSQNGRVS